MVISTLPLYGAGKGTELFKGKQRCFPKKLRGKQNKINLKEENREARKWMSSHDTDDLGRGN